MTGLDSTAASGTPRPRPTMREVATLAGVSIKTVSRVVNGETTVDAELAERVRRAARALDYRPNLTARNLRSSDGRTRTIGVLLENVANPFSSAIHRAIEDAAGARGFAVFAGSLDEDPVRERTLALALVARQVDGLIVMPSGDDQSYLAGEQQAGLKLVFVDRSPQGLLADAVASDNVAGATQGVRHLIAHGHDRIAFLGDRRMIQTATQRFDGYAAALRDAGIPLDEDLVRWELHDEQSAQHAVQELLLEHGPSALFASQNLVTAGAIRALRALGRQHQVALVGLDDFMLADLLEPAITVMSQDPTRIGALACELLFSRIDGDESRPYTRLVEMTLQVRGSGEIAPAFA
jgi:LacI family transcriptional regulator